MLILWPRYRCMGLFDTAGKYETGLCSSTPKGTGGVISVTRSSKNISKAASLITHMHGAFQDPCTVELQRKEVLSLPPPPCCLHSAANLQWSGVGKGLWQSTFKTHVCPHCASICHAYWTGFVACTVLHAAITRLLPVTEIASLKLGWIYLYYAAALTVLRSH